MTIRRRSPKSVLEAKVRRAFAAELRKQALLRELQDSLKRTRAARLAIGIQNTRKSYETGMMSRPTFRTHERSLFDMAEAEGVLDMVNSNLSR